MARYSAISGAVEGQERGYSPSSPIFLMQFLTPQAAQK